MTKTPYEIRLEVLKMAQEMEQYHYEVNRSRMLENWQAAVETARIKNEDPPPMPELPEFPSEETVVKKAQFLGEFINNSGKSTID